MVKEIEITQTFVTPTIMSMLSILIEDCGDISKGMMEELMSLVMDEEINFIAPSRYFLIPELGLYDDALFLELLEIYSFNQLINPRFMNKYDDLINIITGTTTEYHATSYLNYIWEHVPYTQTHDTDVFLYYWSLYEDDDDDLVKSIITKRHIDPAIVQLDENVYRRLLSVGKMILYI